MTATWRVATQVGCARPLSLVLIGRDMDAVGGGCEAGASGDEGMQLLGGTKGEGLRVRGQGKG